MLTSKRGMGIVRYGSTLPIGLCSVLSLIDKFYCIEERKLQAVVVFSLTHARPFHLPMTGPHRKNIHTCRNLQQWHARWDTRDFESEHYSHGYTHGLRTDKANTSCSDRLAHSVSEQYRRQNCWDEETELTFEMSDSATCAMPRSRQFVDMAWKPIHPPAWHYEDNEELQSAVAEFNSFDEIIRQEVCVDTGNSTHRDCA